MMSLVTTDEYVVQNAVEWMLDDLDDDDELVSPSEVELAPALVGCAVRARRLPHVSPATHGRSPVAAQSSPR
jgi:hypothetical protein